MELINSSLNLECKGRIYPIRVCEEQIVNEINGRCRCNTYEGGRDYGSSNVHGGAQKVEAGRKEEDDDVIADEESEKEEVAKRVMADQREGRGELEVEGKWEVVSVESADCLGKSNVILPDIEVSLLREESRQLQRNNHEGQLVDGQIVTHGFISSINGTQRERPGIFLEVNLGQDQFSSQINGPRPCGSNLKNSSQTNEGRQLGPDMVGSKSYVSNSISSFYSDSINNQLRKGSREGMISMGYRNQSVKGGFSGFVRRLG
ncbi:hypothetical protein HYC85_009009 [Camellia sinensis]|uniref:Uncharacterized protein n=1 Tax=Camellia sinensis TaxID=4442 RepID=A0A7J7HTJ2_CAMSI|nr:hypothetical protein HYC85_009009 [Camellia sinensis]